MDHNHAARTVDLTADADAFCEYPPDPLVPFRGSRFYQRIRVTADPSATVIPGEAGRPDGRLLFADRAHLAPRRPTCARCRAAGTA
ncbi:hypothetical protein GCM10027162_52220 [Streptomyces incanus]